MSSNVHEISYDHQSHFTLQHAPKYVLDAQQGRIVILTKDGKLKAQMTAPELKGAHALVIEESTKTGYFVNGNKMYKVTLTI
jgi:hypothetical protein